MLSIIKENHPTPSSGRSSPNPNLGTSPANKSFDFPPGIVLSREGGDIGLLITLVPNFFLFVRLTTLGTFIEFSLVLIKLSVLRFQPLIVIYRMGDFVYHH